MKNIRPFKIGYGETKTVRHPLKKSNKQLIEDERKSRIIVVIATIVLNLRNIDGNGGATNILDPSFQCRRQERNIAKHPKKKEGSYGSLQQG